MHPVDRSEGAARGKGKRLVIRNGAETEINAGLIELIKEAFAIRNQFLSGSDASIEAMSGSLGTNKCRLTATEISSSGFHPPLRRSLESEPSGSLPETGEHSEAP